MRPEPRSYPRSFEVLRIEPSTGAVELVARLPVEGLPFDGSTAHADGALYVLMDGHLFKVAPDVGARNNAS